LRDRRATASRISSGKTPDPPARDRLSTGGNPADVYWRIIGKTSLLAQSTAMQSISTSKGPGHDGTCTKIRAGGSSGKYRAYTSLKTAKCVSTGVQ
jgi:hypothetical protein